MNSKCSQIALLTLLFPVLIALNSCYYDNEQDLYKNVQAAQCDTTNVTYSGSIVPIMQNACYTCHNSTSASGGISVDTYQGLSAICTNKFTSRLWGDVNFLSGFDNMPKGGNKLSACDLKKIEIWLRAGYPQN